MPVPSVSAIADVLGLWGETGWLTPPLHPVVGPPEPVLGRALTVELHAAAEGEGFASMYEVLSGDLSGRILVLAGAEGVPGAIWGEILATAAKAAGATATLLEGWARDVPDIRQLGLPLYASGLRPNGPGGRAHIRSVGGDVSVAGVTVTAEDYIVADSSGCVRVRPDQLDAVLGAALHYAAGESAVLAALAEGEPLTSAYRHKKSVVDDLRRR